MDVFDVVSRPRGEKKKSPVPAGLAPPPRLSGALPVVGHTVEFVRDTIGLLFRAQRELGEVAAFDVAHRRMVAVFGPRAHEAVFRAPDTVLSPSEAYKIMTPIFGKDVVYDASPDKMAEQLKMLLPALQDRRMRTYGEAVVRETEETIRPWGQTGVVDLVEFCRVLTNFTSARCLLGREFREGMSDEFARVYHDLEVGASPLAYLNAHLPIPIFKRRDVARVRMVQMITENVARRRASGASGDDFLQTLMDASYASGEKLSEHEITGLLLAGMFAGHHTSSVTTAWALLELLRDPVAYQRAVAEVDRVFGGGRPVSHAVLRELTYVENVVKEALRLHPPLFMLVRVAQVDWEFGGYHIPKGTWIVISPTVAHRMPEVFRDPDAFDPDRFAEGRAEDKKDFAYIAFGGGRHKCLGNAFAILQVKAILALLLGQFELGLFGDAIESDFQGLVIGPKEPCRVRYRRRARPSVTIAQMAAGQALSERSAAGCPVHGEAANLDKASLDKASLDKASLDGASLGGASLDGASLDGASLDGASLDKASLDKASLDKASLDGASVTEGAPPTGCPVHVADAASPGGVEARRSTKLRIRIDRDLCQGHGVCAGECPQVFAVGRDQKVMLKMPRPPAELYEKVRLAAKHCPTRTIRLEEEGD
jgi:sterol 14-demethylase